MTLSSTRRQGRRTGFWKAMPTFFRGAVTDRPSTRTVPRVAGRRPEISLSRVDLPQPLGPTKATEAPRETVRVMSWSARVERPRTA